MTSRADDVNKGVYSGNIDGLYNRCLFFQWIYYPLFFPSPISDFFLWSDKGYQHPPFWITWVGCSTMLSSSKRHDAQLST